MTPQTERGDPKAVWLLSTVVGILGGLCCLAPIVLVLFGLAGISAAASLGNVLYGDYHWYFRIFALLCLTAGLVIYFRRRGICTLEDAKRQRTRVINVALLAILAGTGVYTLWTYVILHYWGIAVGLPWAQYDESWAVPTSAVFLAAAIAVTYLARRSKAG